MKKIIIFSLASIFLIISFSIVIFLKKHVYNYQSNYFLKGFNLIGREEKIKEILSHRQSNELQNSQNTNESVSAESTQDKNKSSAPKEELPKIIIQDRYPVKDILLFLVYSSVDIQVIAPDGKKVGKNFANGKTFDEIEDAFYSGFEAETEMLTIPYPIKGEYKILTQGTEKGKYEVEVSRISEYGKNGNAKEITAKITGSTFPKKQQQTIFIVSEDEIKIK